MTTAAGPCRSPSAGPAAASRPAAPEGWLSGCAPKREAALSSSVIHSDSSGMAGSLASRTRQPVQIR